MTLKLRKLSILIIAAVMLVAMAFAGAASADAVDIESQEDYINNFSKTTLSADKTYYIKGTWDIPSLNNGTDQLTITGTKVVIDFTNFTGGFTNLPQSGSYIGALFGNVKINPSNTLEIKGLNMTSVKIKLESSKKYAGGIIGYVSSGTLNFSNCTLMNCSISGETSSDYVGGLLGYANGPTVNFEDCKVMYCDVVSYRDYIGGLAGFSYKVSCTRCNVMNSTIASINSDNVGGLVGDTGTPVSLDSCSVENTSVYAGDKYVGGLVGHITSATKIKDCMVKNCVIVSRGEYTGGLVGYVYSSASNIEKCSVIDSTIKGSYDVSGLIGFAGSASSKGEANTIENCAIRGTGSNVDIIKGYLGSGFINCTSNTTNNFLYNGSITDSISFSCTIDKDFWHTISKTWASTNPSRSSPIDQDPLTYLGTYGLGGTYGYGSYNPSGPVPTLTTYVEVSDWDQLVENVSSWTDTTTMRTVVLTNTATGAYKNTTVSSDYAGIPVSGMITITPAKDLGTDIKIDANQMGRIFEVKNGGNITLIGNGSSILNLTGGKLTGSATGGAGAIVQSGGNLTLNDGAMITYCSAGNFGGGLYVNTGARFTMAGGDITGCTASNNGGGVEVIGTFNMCGGKISECYTSGGSSSSGGVCVYTGGTFTMTDGNITNCRGVQSGGGVGISGSTFTMTGGTITNCSAGFGGGIVYLDGICNLGGSCIISGNSASMFGDEVFVANSISVSGNAKINGIGIALMNPGSYPNITASSFTGSVVNITLYDDNPAENPAYWLGQVVVNGSTDKTKFKLSTSSLYSGYKLSASGNNLVLAEIPAAYVEVNTWAGLNKSVSEWTETATIRVVAVNASITDRVAGNNTNGIDVKGNVIVTTTASPLTGNEVVIDGKGIGRLFNVASTGNLTLIGNGTSATLNLTGGFSQSNGAGIFVDDGELYLNEGAMITNCSTNADGGGVYVDSYGNFTMNGSSIVNCTAYSAGGGVYVDDGIFTMIRSNITDCNANMGGGIYINSNGIFIIHDGVIDNCSGNSEGGGVVNSGGSITMNEGAITDCSAPYGGGLENLGTFTMNNGTIDRNIATLKWSELLTSVSIELNGNANIGGNDLGLINLGSYPNITINGGFSGSIANITLYDNTQAENPSAWEGQVVVKNGASVSDKFALSSAYSGYQLLASGNDLILAPKTTSVSIITTFTGANAGLDSVNLTLTQVSSGTSSTYDAGTNTTYTIPSVTAGIYSLTATYTNNSMIHNITKEVTVGTDTVCVPFTLLTTNVTTEVKTSQGTATSAPKVAVDGLDDVAADQQPAAGQKITISLNVEGNSDTNTAEQQMLKNNRTSSSSGTPTFINITVTNITSYANNDTIISNSTMDTVSTVLTIYVEYDMTRENIEVFRVHDGKVESFTEETTKPTNPSDRTFFNGDTGIYIYTQKFSSYMISSTARSSPVTPSSGSSSSSHHSGSSQLAKSPTVTPTAEPTAVPTQTSTTVITSSPTASATSSTTPSSPAPVIGLIAGLGAVALFLGRLRK